MNAVEFNRLTKCRSLLDKIAPSNPKEVKNLEEAKFILDDILEFKIFPKYPGFDYK